MSLVPYVLQVFPDELNQDLIQTFDLKNGENLIGRDPIKCQIILNFPTKVRTIHAKITIDKEEISLESLIPSNRSRLLAPRHD